MSSSELQSAKQQRNKKKKKKKKKAGKSDASRKRKREEQPILLFDEEAQSEEEKDRGGFVVNKDYARKYEEKKRQERISKLRSDIHRLDSELEDTSEEEDEVGELMTAEIENDFLRVVAKLKNKDPSVYDPSVQFFKQEGDSLAKLKKKKKKAQEESGGGGERLTAREFLLQDMIAEAQEAEEKAEADAAQAEAKKKKKKKKKKRKKKKKNKDKKGENDAGSDDGIEKLPYVAQQKKLKEEFLAAVDAAEEDGAEEPEGGFGDGLLLQRSKTREEEAAFEKEYAEFLKKKREETLSKGGEEAKFWLKPAEKLDEKERFLRDFFMSSGWVDEDPDGTGPAIQGFVEDEPLYEGDVPDFDDEEDEEHVEKQEQFEAEYNFRFEEQPQLVSYPRDVPSIRRKESKHQKERARRQRKKEEERVQKAEELKRLKAEKRKEIMGKLKDVTERDFQEMISNMDDEEMERYMDEYFNLDYEDVIGGGEIPTRFKYTKVKQEDFGLQPEEILALEDRELQTYVPLHALAPYREEEWVPTGRKKHWVRKKIQEVEQYADPMEDLEEAQPRNRKRRKGASNNKKKKKKRRQVMQ